MTWTLSSEISLLENSDSEQDTFPSGVIGRKAAIVDLRTVVLLKIRLLGCDAVSTGD
jgi:hypothetical protein